MSRPPKPAGGACPQQREQCALQCKYNYFQADDLEIHSWELKCLDCGFRQTIGFRSDEEDVDWSSGKQKICPFCQATDMTPGKNPCG